MKGKVTDEKGEPISEVIIAIKGKFMTETTDAKSNFKLKLNDILVFGKSGFKEQAIKVDGQTEINVKLIDNESGSHGVPQTKIIYRKDST